MQKHLRFLITAIALLTLNQLKAQQAELQFIQNSADPALQFVDVYVNDSLVADDMVFRSATAMLALPADSLLTIGIALNTSTSVADTLKSFQITMQDTGRYIALINGVLDSAQFAPNPNGASTALNILFQNNIALLAANPSNVDFIIEQGATDLGISDFVIRDDKTIADNITYNAFTGYDSVAAISFTLDITPSTNDSILSSYQIDFSGMDGSAAVLIASGFQDAAANQNGPSLGFIAVFPNGSVLEFFQVSIAKFQAINNCADPLLDSIDIYTNGVLVVDNFHFRTATNLFDVPGGVPITVAIAPGNSTSINDTIRSYTLTFENGKNYIGIATGVIDTAAFAPNPEALNTSFTFLLSDGMRWKAQSPSAIDFRFVNGVTDAPTVDIKQSGAPVVVDNTPFATLTPYTSIIAAGTYNVDVTNANNTIIYDTYQFDGNPYSGQSAVLFFSGFLNPANNQNGALYGLYAAFSDGQTIQLPIITGIENLTNNSSLNVYPNPANDLLNVQLGSGYKSSGTLKIFSLDSRLVFQNNFDGNTIQVNTKNLKSGIYFVQAINGSEIITSKFVKE